ncbi:hypothetical protein COV17_02595 [Candidatus Woesearchaeota archaeon CG10_big_fil_rev_8_21_14_0_10_36_11]|nr:MAG: hypothetical protein COV17_02595 [Candidatus Woesearchaeota archaeon CG10_big_fil_rev_8_21_14_0_10_36_11]
MTLSNEAAYLYIYSKELTKINKKLHRLSKRAEKEQKKHERTKSIEKKLKYKINHAKITEKIKELTHEHNKYVVTLKRHSIAFEHSLRKEHTL